MRFSPCDMLGENITLTETRCTCQNFLLEDPDKTEGGVHNIFMTQTENVCVIDSGCPKSVMSQMWANTYKASLMNTDKFQNYPFKEKKEHELFKFGPSNVYTSTKAMKIPIVIGEEVKEVEVSIVHANIPFLLGRDYLDKWNCQLLFKENSLIVNKEKKVQLETNRQGHFILNLLDAETEVVKIRDTFFINCEEKELKEKLKKIHIMTAHKQEETLIRFLKGSKNYNPKVRELLSEVIQECVTCKTMRKTPDRLKVALPKASQPNEVLSIDLKEMRDEGLYVLFITDECTRYTRGQIIKSKQPKEVIEAIEANWVLRSPGCPARASTVTEELSSVTN